MSSSREINDYLVDILESIADLRDFTDGMTFEGFCADRKTINACIRSLEVIGEATKKIPLKLDNKNPPCPGRQFLECVIN